MKKLLSLLVLVPLMVLAGNLYAATGHITPGSAPELGSVMLAWTASPGPNITNYRIYYGTEGPGLYTQMAVFGNVTNCTIGGLTRGLTNWFVCTAINSSNLESDPSNEVNARIPLKPAPPNFNSISNLVVQTTIQAAPTPDGPWRDLLSPEPTQVENPETAAFFRSKLYVYAPLSEDRITAMRDRIDSLPKPPVPK